MSATADYTRIAERSLVHGATADVKVGGLLDVSKMDTPDTVTAGGLHQGTRAGPVIQATVNCMHAWGVTGRHRWQCARSFLLAQTELLCGRLAIRRTRDQQVDRIFQYMICGGASLARLIWPRVNVGRSEQMLVNWLSRKWPQPARGKNIPVSKWRARRALQEYPITPTTHVLTVTASVVTSKWSHVALRSRGKKIKFVLNPRVMTRKSCGHRNFGTTFRPKTR